MSDKAACESGGRTPLRTGRCVRLAGAAAALALGLLQAAARERLFAPIPIPQQAPAEEGLAPLGETRLWYWSAGTGGAPIVLLHPASGSALIWGYQQPVFVEAGHRVIAYSRRGYYNSAPFEHDRPGIGSEDLRALVDFLGIRRFHLVGSAAGGSIAADFAFSHPDRLLSLTISSNSLGVRDGAIAKAAAAIRPKGLAKMPPAFRELGASYRAVNPDGVRLWVELERKALRGNDYRQKLRNRITQDRLKELKVPTLLIAGAADMLMPPSIVRMIADAIPGSKLVVVPETGHSVYWEQPEIFNRAILDFVAAHSK